MAVAFSRPSLEQRVAELAACVEQLASEVERLKRQQRRGTRDDDDRRVVVAIALAIGARSFTSREVIAHTRVASTTLAAVLAVADCETPRSLGRLLRRCEGLDIDGHTVRRAGVENTGIVWRIHRGPAAT
jgi:hypothetical protein